MREAHFTIFGFWGGIWHFICQKYWLNSLRDQICDFGLRTPFLSATCVHGGFPNSSSTLGPNLPSRLFLAPKKVSGWNVSKQDADGHSCLPPGATNQHQPTCHGELVPPTRRVIGQSAKRWRRCQALKKPGCWSETLCIWSSFPKKKSF